MVYGEEKMGGKNMRLRGDQGENGDEERGERDEGFACCELLKRRRVGAELRSVLMFILNKSPSPSVSLTKIFGAELGLLTVSVRRAPSPYRQGLSQVS